MRAGTLNSRRRMERRRSGIPGRWHYLSEEQAQCPPPSPPDAPVSALQSSIPNQAVRGDRIAFVLQGGGSLAAAQVGMLQALAEAGIQPDLVVGSSAGAINGVVFASDPTLSGLARLEALWQQLDRRQVAPLSLPTLLAALTGRRDGLFPDTGLRRQLEAHLLVRDLSETCTAVHVVATELESGNAVVLSHGDAVTALLASSAFPGMYPPVLLGHLHLIDGGVAADVPVLQAEALGVGDVYVLPAAADAPSHTFGRGPLPLAYSALGQVLGGIARRDIAAAGSRIRIRVLPTIVSAAGNPVDFRYTTQQIATGYERTARWIREEAQEGAIAIHQHQRRC
jgi:NTE family protein